MHYFSNAYERGPDWYSEQFASFGEQQFLLEFSVSYTYPEYSALVAERIRETVPDVKLFVLVRDPIDRAFSDYLRSTRMLELDARMTFEQAVECDPALLTRGLYGSHLSEFYVRFPADQITVLSYDDLIKDSAEFVARLCHFLGVDPQLSTLSLERTEATGKRVRSPGMNRLIFGIKHVADSVMNRVSRQYWERFKARHLAFYSRIVDANTESISLLPATRKRLREYFARDIELLEQLVQRDFSHWCEAL